MSDKVFTGQVKNVADGDIFDITVTSVDSVPCIDPYCDTIIAEEKAELREGLCADCYKKDVDKCRSPGNKLKIISGVAFFLGLLIFSLSVYFYFQPVSPSSPIQPKIAFVCFSFFSIGFMLYIAFVLIKMAKTFEKQTNLHLKKRKQEKEKCKDKVDE